MQFNYHSPKTETELTVLLNGMEDYCLLAGGTDVMVKMKEKLISAKNIVDVSGIESLKGIRETGDSIWIGPLATHRELMDSAIINKKAMALCLAASEVGSPQIRNVGTAGGNIGNASPAADTVPVLLVLAAKVRLNGSAGSEDLPLEKVFVGPGKTCLKPANILPEFRFRRFPLAKGGHSSNSANAKPWPVPSSMGLCGFRYATV